MRGARDREAVAIPAYQTLIPELVEDRLVPAATALNSAAFNTARVVGPAIGGAFVAAGKADLAFGIDAVSFLVVVAVLLRVPSMGQADGPASGCCGRPGPGCATCGSPARCC